MMATFNFNVGVLGHVDSGKTSLSKALSTVESTASFDKNPQSRERGITLDLGFSSFSVDIPEHLREAAPTCQRLQYTLVDCPGHASLIRTIIGGKYNDYNNGILIEEFDSYRFYNVYISTDILKIFCITELIARNVIP